MDGRKFLKVAQELLLGKTSAHWRSAASRAYYGLMLEGREALRRWGILPPPGVNIHAFVRLRFHYATDPDLKEIGTKLDELVQIRNRADYDMLTVQFQTAADAVKALANALDALRLLDDIDGDAAKRTAAAADIKAQWP